MVTLRTNCTDQHASVPPRPAAWMRWTMLLAGGYNLAWGAAVILAPNLFFDLAGIARPLYPSIWQCVGMIVGVYGVGYLIAASDPVRWWAIVLVGFLGKLFGPIGFIFAMADGVFPITFAWTILTNDLIWWVPFGAILYQAAKHAGWDRRMVRGGRFWWGGRPVRHQPEGPGTTEAEA